MKEKAAYALLSYFFQADVGIRDRVASRGRGDEYKGQEWTRGRQLSPIGMYAGHTTEAYWNVRGAGN